MRAAIYARVSTERQEQQQTIGSQVATLRDWAAARDHVLAEAHVFRDEGTAAPAWTAPRWTRSGTPSATPPSTWWQCSAPTGSPASTPTRSC